MASRPDFDADDPDATRPASESDRADDAIDDLADGEQAAVETALTRLPPG